MTGYHFSENRSKLWDCLKSCCKCLFMNRNNKCIYWINKKGGFMKTLGKLKLTQLSKAELEKRELNKISGGESGECCICAHGATNHKANAGGGLYSPSLAGTFTEYR